MKRAVVGAGLALMALAPVWAGRPLQTDDADTLERAACEIEGGRDQRSARDDSSGENALALACGIGFDSQLGLGFVRERGRSDASRGLQLGGKTQLWQAAPEGATLTLAWALGAGRPDGGEWRHEHNDLTLVASLPAGPGQLHLNVGHARDLPSRLVSTPWGIAWEHGGLAWRSLKWAPMAEVFGDDHGSAWWNAGARLVMREEQLSLNAAYGCRWRNDRTCLATLGFKLSF